MTAGTDFLKLLDEIRCRSPWCESRWIEESSGSSFIKFVTTDDRVHGFVYAQLMNYTLERMAENEHKSDAPQDHLQLFFSTHDVTLHPLGG